MENADHDMPEGAEKAPPGTSAMAAVRWALVGGAFTIAALTWFLYWNTMEARGGQVAIEQRWHCPMHPAVVQDHPGECPICGMDLVPIESASPSKNGNGGAKSHANAKNDANHGAVPGLAPIKLAPERVELLGMRTGRAERRRLGEVARAVGYVAPDERGLGRLETRVAGWIESLDVAETGQRVARGQTIATIYSPDVYAAEQELLNARRWAERPTTGAPEAGRMTSSLLDDARHRLELLGVAPAEIAAIERAGRPLRAVPIRAAVGGHVIQRSAVVGTYVQPGAELAQVADLSTVWVIAEVPESDAARVRRARRARFRTAGGTPVAARVDLVYPAIAPDTRTLRVRLSVPNPGLRLLPGMYGDVEIEIGASDALVIPAEALVDTGDTQYVFLAREGGRFEPRRVETGARQDDRVEIRSGLAEGDVVVTTANFLLDSESRLRAALDAYDAPPPAAPPPGPGPAPAPDAAPGHDHDHHQHGSR